MIKIRRLISRNSGIGCVLFALLGLLAGIVGWVANIVQLVFFTSITPLFVLKVIGIFFAPLGAVLGLVGFW